VAVLVDHKWVVAVVLVDMFHSQINLIQMVMLIQL
jgi:hypothetical protein